MHPPSYFIWGRIMDSNIKNGKKTSSSPAQHGKKHIKHHLQGQENQQMDQGADPSSRHLGNHQNQKMDMGRPYQPQTRQSLELNTHTLDTLWEKEKQRTPTKAMEGRAAKLLGRSELVPTSTKQRHMETSC